MKERELLQHATCALCGKPIGHAGLPLFWRVTVERFGIDLRAIRRQAGLGMMLQSHALAAVMGPDEDMATPMMDKVVVTLCEPCGSNLDGHAIPAVLAEVATKVPADAAGVRDTQTR